MHMMRLFSPVASLGQSAPACGPPSASPSPREVTPTGRRRRRRRGGRQRHSRVREGAAGRAADQGADHAGRARQRGQAPGVRAQAQEVPGGPQGVQPRPQDTDRVAGVSARPGPWARAVSGGRSGRCEEFRAGKSGRGVRRRWGARPGGRCEARRRGAYGVAGVHGQGFGAECGGAGGVRAGGAGRRPAAL